MAKKHQKRHRRRRKTLKQQAIFTIFSLFLFVGAIVVGLSFFQNGSVLDDVRMLIVERFGWEGVLLPIILFFFALLFLRLNFALARPHVSFGLLLTYVCLLALARSGTFGEEIWFTFSSTISPIGAALLLLLMLFIGLIVLFNMSLEELGQMIGTFFGGLAGIFVPLFSRKGKPQFIEKLPLKPSADFKLNGGKTDFKTNRNDSKPVEERTPMQIKTPPKLQTVAGGTLGSSVLTNTPNSTTAWEYPPVSLLVNSTGQKADRGDLKQNAHIIEKTLESFGITARVAEVNLGPAVTQYALEIALGTKVSKITSLANDLTLRR